ncbi:hypothetical protein AD951_08485 [Acetobacter malorum]|uniref:Single-stranded DNA-binding protein n=1 Tax=Acetobacter malorum TaxID=178901 RepID=A0A149UM65_9PROT|nr:single-stranded DNA-binding protein [Acetobacter malorum]KXV69061.1 hypothetical protein AD951_08485 [Acetobacter malorum]
MPSVHVLTGHIGKNPEVHTFESGKQKASFSVAVNAGYMKDGEWQDETDWHDVVTFSPELIEKLTANPVKGRLVQVTGPLKPRKYTKQGESSPRTSWETIAFSRASVVFLGGKNTENDGGDNAG